MGLLVLIHTIDGRTERWINYSTGFILRKGPKFKTLTRICKTYSESSLLNLSYPSKKIWDTLYINMAFAVLVKNHKEFRRWEVWKCEYYRVSTKTDFNFIFRIPLLKKIHVGTKGRLH